MSGGRWQQAVSIAGTVLLATGALAACSSSSSNGGASGKNSPIKIMGMFDLSNTQGTQQKAANVLVATVDAINAAGGIKGRKMEVITCDSQLSANGSAACGREAVTDGVVATIGFAASAAYNASTIPAHIADFSAYVDPTTMSASNSFTFWGGALAATSGLAAMGKPLGCKKIAWVNSQVPPADRAKQAAAFAATAEDSGMQVATPVFPVSGSPDMTPFAETAISEGIDCAGVQGEGSDEVGLVKAFHELKPSVKIITGVPYTSGNEAALGSLMSSIYIQDVADEATDTSNPVVREWVSDINKYSPSPKDLEADSAILWAEVKLVAYAADHVSNPDAASIEKYLSQLSYYNPGVLPPVSFTHPYNTSLGTRVFGPVMTIVTYKNGNYYDTGPFYNVFTGDVWKVSATG